MPRFRLTVEYDGAPFVGWQRQDNGPSVQQALEDAVFGFCGERVLVYGAGRTDTGVHALGQVAHLDLQREATAKTLREALNFHLRPKPVAVIDAAPTAPDFHARFSATARVYRYRILNRPAPPVLDHGRVWWIPRPLDVTAMVEAGCRLVGRHDFTTFRSIACGADDPVKTLSNLILESVGEEIRIEAMARSFLHNQVRIMVGTLSLVGLGRWSPDDITKALDARDRTRGGPTAPPQGLYLLQVRY